MTFDPIPYARAEMVRPVLERDRRGALIGFGVGSLNVGALAGCGTVGMLLTFLMMFRMGASVAPLPMAEIAVALGVYASIATLFIWVGIDSIRCKRWVRPMVIAVGWLTMVWMAFGVAFMLATLKDREVLLGNAPATQATTSTLAPGATMTVTTSPAGEGLVAYCVMLGVMVLILLVAALYTWFYSTDAVRETLAAYDPGPSWTERCPVPVFVACTGLLLFALGTATTSVQGVVPLFGIYVSGPVAVVLDLGAAGLMLASAVLMYRMKGSGVMLAATVVGLGFLSAVITFGRLGVMEFYRRGQASADELDRLAKSAAMTGMTPIVFSALAGALCVGYLLWVRRHFRADVAKA